MAYGYLMHYGIKGQKWGVRRYQNPDGSLTALGREHYGIIGERAVARIQDATTKKIRSMSPEQKKRLSAAIERSKFDPERHEENKKVVGTIAGVSLASTAIMALAGLTVVGAIAAIKNPEAAKELVGTALEKVGGLAISAAKGVGKIAVNAMSNPEMIKESIKDFIQDKIKTPKAEQAMYGGGKFNTLTKMAKGVAKYGTEAQKEKFVKNRLTDLKGNKAAFGTLADTILKMENNGDFEKGTLSKAVANFGQLSKAKSGAKEAIAAGTTVGVLTSVIGGATKPIINLVNEVTKVKSAYDSPGGKLIREQGKNILDKMGLNEEKLREEELKKKQGGNQ